MKRTSDGTAPLRGGPGMAADRVEDAGLGPEDAVLLSKLRRGRPAAVDALIDRYHGTVYGLAMSILRDRSDAEDAAREVFVTVLRKADRFRGNRVLSSWIYRICVDVCLVQLGKRRGIKTVPIEEFLPVFTPEGAHAMPVEDWSREVERRLPGKELGRVIDRFAAELPEQYRMVFALCDVQGLSHAETAQVLDVTIAAVKSRLRMARLCLRERLGRHLLDGSAV